MADDQTLAAIRRLPLLGDFHGQIAVTMDGEADVQDLVLTAGVIDTHAREFFDSTHGGTHGHRLAAALHCLTGWPVITVDARRDGGWVPIHSAVRIPDGHQYLLDIHGRHRPGTVEARYRRGDESVRHRQVDVCLMPGDALADPGHDGWDSGVSWPNRPDQNPVRYGKVGHYDRRRRAGEHS